MEGLPLLYIGMRSEKDQEAPKNPIHPRRKKRDVTVIIKKVIE